LNQLTSLDRPVTFTLVYGRGLAAMHQRDRVVQLLESCRTINPRRIQITSFDPYSDLTRLEDLVKRVPDLAMLPRGGVLIECGAGQDAESGVVRNQEMFEPIRLDQVRDNFDRFETVFTGEDAITSALIRLREGKKAKVAFTAGHKEPDTSDRDPRGKGIGNWKARLMAIGCEVIDLNLVEGDIPEALSLLIVVNPSDPFKPSEVAKLRAYVDRGGPVLLVLGNAGPTGLEDLLKSFNLEIGQGIVIDPRFRYEGNLELVLAPARERGMAHPIVGAMEANQFVLLPQAAPLHVYGMSGRGGAMTQPVDRSLVPTVILRTSLTSWAETDRSNPRPTLDRSADEPGPVIVGVA